MTESNHQVKCSYYSHQIPITPTADFLSLPQAGIASLSLFVLHSYSTPLLPIWYTFCHVSFLSTPISLLLPQRLVALPVPCSIILIYSLGTYAINSSTPAFHTHSWNFNGPLCIQFSWPWSVGKFKSLKLVFFPASSIPPLVYFLSLCLMHAQKITLVLWRWSVLNCFIQLCQQT